MILSASSRKVLVFVSSFNFDVSKASFIISRVFNDFWHDSMSTNVSALMSEPNTKYSMSASWSLSMRFSLFINYLMFLKLVFLSKPADSNFWTSERVSVKGLSLSEDRYS